MNSDSSTSDTGHKASAVFDFIVYEVKETLALITINRPEKLNAINPAMEVLRRTFDLDV